MSALTANDVVGMWERGLGQEPAAQALTMLAVARPAQRDDELRRLTLGQRNAQVLALRQRLFGSELNAVCECPQCGARLEFAVDVDALRDPAPPPLVDADLEVETDGYVVRFRPLDTNDLLAAAAAADIEAARGALVERCVLHARHAEAVVTAAELPPPVVERLAARLSDADPQAEALVALACPACDFRWRAPFDVASFCYAEIGAEARRLLADVDTLARAYGWRESDILEMSARRRQSYLEMVLR